MKIGGKRGVSGLAGVILALALCLLAGPARAWTIDFSNGTWDHSAYGGPPSSTGWDPTRTGGVADLGDGNSVTAEYAPAGTASPTGQNMTFLAYGADTRLAMVHNADSDEGNDPSLTNYGTFTLQFDTPVDLDPYKMLDIDTYEGVGTGEWVDAVAFEAWTSGGPGAVGTGIQPDVYSFSPTTRLTLDTTTYDLNAAYAVVGGLTNGNADSEVEVEWFSNVQAVRFYFFDQKEVQDTASTHGVLFEDTMTGVTAVPEPGGAMCLGVAALLLGARRRREQHDGARVAGSREPVVRGPSSGGGRPCGADTIYKIRQD